MDGALVKGAECPPYPTIPPWIPDRGADGAFALPAHVVCTHVCGGRRVCAKGAECVRA
jgi:hypothetical protein